MLATKEERHHLAPKVFDNLCSLVWDGERIGTTEGQGLLLQPSGKHSFCQHRKSKKFKQSNHFLHDFASKRHCTFTPSITTTPVITFLNEESGEKGDHATSFTLIPSRSVPSLFILASVTSLCCSDVEYDRFVNSGIVMFYIFTKFEKGFHVIRRSNQLWASLTSDLVIKTTLMRWLKTGGMTHGGRMSEEQRAIWTMSRPITHISLKMSGCLMSSWPISWT